MVLVRLTAVRCGELRLGGFRWVHPGPSGFSWVQLGSAGFSWSEMDRDGSRWVQMGFAAPPLVPRYHPTCPRRRLVFHTHLIIRTSRTPYLVRTSQTRLLGFTAFRLCTRLHYVPFSGAGAATRSPERRPPGVSVVRPVMGTSEFA
jgi:hypothetical protein